jgi:hypothetical protein
MSSPTATLALVAWLPWRPALVAAAVLGVVAAGLRAQAGTRRASRIVGEAALVTALYAVWQYASSLVGGAPPAAREAGLWLDRVERLLMWPSEAAIQQQVLGVGWLVHAANVYYSVVHVPVFVATLVWVLFRHIEDWSFARTTVSLLTGMCLLIQFWAVAPPRLLPSLGVVDTAAGTGDSVYDRISGANQYAAMPSVHVAWAAAVALLVIVSADSRWRWLALAYPLLTTWVVIVTGNHFLIDGVVSVLLLALAVGITLLFPSQRPRRLSRRAARSVGEELEPALP